MVVLPRVTKRFSIWRRVVKELLKGINVPLGTFDAQYDIENTSVWSLGGQRIFLRKTSYLSSTLNIGMKFRTQIGKNPYSPENMRILRRICGFSGEYEKKTSA